MSNHVDIKIKNEDLFNKVVEEEHAAKRFGFYWNNAHQLIDQILSECEEIKQAMMVNDQENLKEEIGDLIHAAVCLSIFFNLDPKSILEGSINKFRKRFEIVKELVKKDNKENLCNESIEVLLSYWNKAKILSKV